MKIKECIIALDGIDKTGKDTIKRELIKKSNGKILILNRAFISQIAYNRIYNRNIHETFFFENIEKYANLGMMFFYLKSDKDILKKRFIQHNEKDLNIEDIVYHQNVFEQVIKDINKKYKNIIINKINTTEFDIDFCTTLILNLIVLNQKRK